MPDEYLAGWRAVNHLIRRGHSWSGFERNRAFLNTGGRRFAQVAAVAGLDQPDDSRALVACDWDGDGDLDLWTSNRTAPQVRYLRNDQAGGGHFLEVKLEGTQPRTPRDAIGARVEIEVAGGGKLSKTVAAGGGFLSQTSRWLHFGLGPKTEIAGAVVRWPGGEAERFEGLTGDARFVLRQGTGRAEPAERREIRPGPASEPAAPRTVDEARVVLVEKRALPAVEYEGEEGRRAPLAGGGRARLICLWAGWCRPCVEELSAWEAQRAGLAEAGVEVVALNVEALTGGQAEVEFPAALARARGAFTFGRATPEVLAALAEAREEALDVHRPLPLPSSFLLDAQGELVAFYLGRLSGEQLLADTRLVALDPSARRAAACPFPGRWIVEQYRFDPLDQAEQLLTAGKAAAAERVLEGYVAQETARQPLGPVAATAEERQRFARAGELLGESRRLQGRREEAALAYRQALRYDPDRPLAQAQLGALLLHADQHEAARAYLEAAVRSKPEDAAAQVNLGLALQRSGLAHEALHHFRAAVRAAPDWPPALNNLSWLLATHVDDTLRDGREAVSLAERMCAATETPENEAPAAELLDTLAAAYAEHGEWERAAQTARRALAATAGAAGSAVFERRRARIDLFAARRPYRDLQAAAARPATRRVPDADRFGPAGPYVAELLSRQDGPERLRQIAWLVATHADVQVRDAAWAVEVARELCRPDAVRRAENFDLLGAALAAQGQFEEAVQAADAALSLGNAAEPTAQAEEIRARRELFQNKLPFQETPSLGFEPGPTEHPLRRKLAYAHLSLARGADATNTALRRELLATALLFEPRYRAALVEAGTLALEQGAAEQAVDLLGKAITIAESDPLALNNLGLAQQRLGRLGRAVACFLDAAEQHPDWPPPANNLGWLLATSSQAELRDGVAAEWFAARAQAGAPGDAASADTLAAARAEQGDFARAAQLVEQALVRGGLSAVREESLRDRLAGYRERRAHREEHGAAATVEDRVDFHTKLGTYFLQAGESETALRHLQAAKDLAPQDVVALNNLGLCYERRQRPREAVACYREALAQREDWPQALNNLAWLLATHPSPEVRQPEEALQLARRLHESTGGTHPSFLDTLAAACAAAGRMDEAREVARRAVAAAEQVGDAAQAARLRERWKGFSQGASKP